MQCLISQVELELISDVEMYLFFQKCTRGGVSCICKRYSQASNKYIKANDPKQEPKHIIYLDANNLYGYYVLEFNQSQWLKPYVEYKV